MESNLGPMEAKLGQSQKQEFRRKNSEISNNTQNSFNKEGNTPITEVIAKKLGEASNATYNNGASY